MLMLFSVATFSANSNDECQEAISKAIKPLQEAKNGAIRDAEKQRSSAEAFGRKNQELEAELRSLKEKGDATELQQQVHALTKENEALRNKLSHSEKETRLANEASKRNEERASGKDQVVREYQGKLRSAEKEIADLQADLARHKSELDGLLDINIFKVLLRDLKKIWRIIKDKFGR